MFKEASSARLLVIATETACEIGEVELGFSISDSMSVVEGFHNLS